MAVRSALHARGLRYRLHVGDLPGKPDIVFPRQRVAVFVDGDFWHGNAWRLRGLNSLDDLFPNNRDFWVAKIERNQARDADVNRALADLGWVVVRIWESDVQADVDASVDRVVAELARENF